MCKNRDPPPKSPHILAYCLLVTPSDVDLLTDANILFSLKIHAEIRPDYKGVLSVVFRVKYRLY